MQNEPKTVLNDFHPAPPSCLLHTFVRIVAVQLQHAQRFRPRKEEIQNEPNCQNGSNQNAFDLPPARRFAAPSEQTQKRTHRGFPPNPRR
jgi:hypothetical protein